MPATNTAAALTVTSPATGRTATISYRTADILAGTFSARVVVGGRLAADVLVGADDTVTVLAALVTATLGNGSLDDRDAREDEVALATATARYMWRQVAAQARADRKATLAAKAAEFAADGEGTKAARLLAAAQ